MPIAQPGKEPHALCHEHHVDMGPSQIALMIEGELSVTPAYACPRPDCFVHYATSHGYFLGVRLKIDVLRTDPMREVIHIGLSGTVGVA